MPRSSGTTRPALFVFPTEEQWEGANSPCTGEITRALTMRQSSFVKVHASKLWSRNSFVIWVTCFFCQFGRSIVRADYLTLRRGFIMNHNLMSRYDFHSYMIRSMEEEFKMIVGVSAPLWGFVVAFILLNVNGSNLYFWIAIIPITNAFELASFFWFWWQFGYDSCFLRKHSLVYVRLILGFVGQFLCSYSTLPLYALATQMGTNYKAALIPNKIRETMHGWGKAARRRRKHRQGIDESAIPTETGIICSIEEDEQYLFEDLADNGYVKIELQPAIIKTTNTAPTTPIWSDHYSIRSSESCHNGAGMPLLKPCSSVPSSPSLTGRGKRIARSISMPA